MRGRVFLLLAIAAGFQLGWILRSPAAEPPIPLRLGRAPNNSMTRPAPGQGKIERLPALPRSEAPAADGMVPNSAAGQGVLTLADLENLALANNPTIPAAQSLVTQQQGLWKQAGLYPNPTLGYLRTDANQAGQSVPQGAFFSQDIVTAQKLRLARWAETQEIEWRTWQLNAQRARVLNDVRIRYYEVLGAQENMRVATEVERLAMEGVSTAEQLLQAQQGSRPDLLQAEIQLQLVRSTLEDSKHRYQAAWQQLGNVVGLSAMQPVTLAGSLETELPQFDWETSLPQLLAESPVLKAQAAQIRAAQYDVTLARAEAIPNLNVQLVAQHDPVQKFDSLSTLASVPIPVFNRNQGNIQNALGQLQQQQREYERIQLALSDQLSSAFQQYQSARSQAERLRSEILPRAKENLELTTRAYKLRQFDILRVFSARQVYFETHLAYIDALTTVHKLAAEIAGLELTGGLNPTEVGTALQTQPGAGVGARNILLQQLQQESRGGSHNLPGSIQGGSR